MSWEISFSGDGEENRAKPRKSVPKFLLRARERAAKINEEVVDDRSPSPLSSSSSRIKSAPPFSRDRLSNGSTVTPSPSVTHARKSATAEKTSHQQPRHKSVQPRKLFSPQAKTAPSSSPAGPRPASAGAVGRRVMGQARTLSSGKASNTPHLDFSRLAAPPERKLGRASSKSAASPRGTTAAANHSPSTQPSRKKESPRRDSPKLFSQSPRPLPRGQKASPPLRSSQTRGVPVHTKSSVTPPPDRQAPQHRGAGRSQQPLAVTWPNRSSPPLEGVGSLPEDGVTWPGEGEEEQQQGVGVAWEVSSSDSLSREKSPPRNPRSAQPPGSRADGKKSPASEVLQQQRKLPSLTSAPTRYDSLEQLTESPAPSGPRFATCPQDFAERRVFDLHRWYVQVHIPSQ